MIGPSIRKCFRDRLEVGDEQSLALGVCLLVERSTGQQEAFDDWQNLPDFAFSAVRSLNTIFQRRVRCLIQLADEIAADLLNINIAVNDMAHEHQEAETI